MKHKIERWGKVIFCKQVFSIFMGGGHALSGFLICYRFDKGLCEYMEATGFFSKATHSVSPE